MQRHVHAGRDVVDVLQASAHIRKGFTHLFVGCEQAQVGVEPGGDRVVIAGAKVGIAPGYAIGISTHQQREFAMRL